MRREFSRLNWEASPGSITLIATVTAHYMGGDDRIGYDLFMGLARSTAMPIVVATALLCAPLTAQTRANETDPKRLIDKADRLAWLYN